MRSFRDKDLHRFHGHEHKCSGSTPTSTMHFFPFTSTFENIFVLKIISGEAPVEYDLCEVSGLHTDFQKAKVQPIGHFRYLYHTR